jgi:hypothetical protein
VFWEHYVGRSGLESGISSFRHVVIWPLVYGLVSWSLRSMTRLMGELLALFE